MENPNSDDKNEIIKLIDKMKNDGISCDYCRKHFISWTNNNDIKKYYNNRNDLINYFIKLHNDINSRNFKKIFKREEVDNIYINFNDNTLKNHSLDIISLFNKRKLDIFPDIINNETRQILLDNFLSNND